jgi:hypothetical protein
MTPERRALMEARMAEIAAKYPKPKPKAPKPQVVVREGRQVAPHPGFHCEIVTVRTDLVEQWRLADERWAAEQRRRIRECEYDPFKVGDYKFNK